MAITGNLLKMQAELDNPVRYLLVLDQQTIELNELVGKTIRLEHTGEINCIACGRKTAKSYGQGYCYPCFISVPETEECVLRPELCRAHEGHARDMNYASSHCLIDHVVYLAQTSQIKVGITRHTQVPTRWIDQGAWRVIKLAITPNRYTAGQVEVSLKALLPDKTNWRDMLRDIRDANGNLVEIKNQLFSQLTHQFDYVRPADNTVTEITYPIIAYPQKVVSVGLDKHPVFEGRLMGIRGQYLILENGNVLNIRTHNGYKVHLTF